MILIGVDTGGTFTDFIFKDQKGWSVLKLPSTPHNPAEAVLKGIEKIAGRKRKKIVHGSTVATNALLERKGAKTALITNKGFEDIIEIGRQNRTRLYDLRYRKEPPLVPKDLRFGIKGRIVQSGEELEPLSVDELRGLVERLREENVESVAVCLLFSFLNPEHEKIIGKALKESGLIVSLSHEILSEFREFERASTTLINAYVCPKMKNYISHIKGELSEEDSLNIMQSNGGSISSETAMRESVRTILSGPAGGVMGAYELGRMIGTTKLITFDMGGTSTDVSLIDGTPSLTVEATISGFPIKVPMIDIHTVGAGGGSIAYLDMGGSLRVGPESAGADPGPICYGRGESITVTDANLMLGRLVPERFLGGEMRLYPERLTPYFEDLANRAGLEVFELAEGIISVVNGNMERAIRVISVERGYDPREFVLFSFGGAGGMHAPFLARLLGIPKVLIPKDPGILSAIGMLMSEIIKDYSFTIMKDQDETDIKEISSLFKDMESKAMKELLSEGVKREDVVFERIMDMRYEGQSYEIMVPLEENYLDAFHRIHERQYGYRNPERKIQIVNLRLRARGRSERPKFYRLKEKTEKIPKEAVLFERDIIFDQRSLRCKIYEREKLRYGNRIKGPALICEYSSTIVIPPFTEAEVDEYANIILKIEG